MFTFGKLFPTHLLTFVYQSSGNFGELILPFVILVALQVILFRVAVKRFDGIEIAR